MPQAKKEFELTGRHVLMMLVGFFGVILVANIFLVYYSQKSWTGLLPGNGYEASIKYNAEAKKARALLAKGWRARLDVTRTNHLAISLRDRGGEPVSGLTTEVSIGRPVGNRYDRKIALVERAIGVYQTQEALAPGAWRVDARFLRAGELVWRVNAEFIVREKK